MTGPRNAGREYTGKHRRDGSLGLPGPAYPVSRGGRADSYGWPNPDARSATGAVPMPGNRPEPGLRPEAGPWADVI
jgi:hypothetical protein